MTKKILLATAALTLGATAFAQNGNVGIGTTTPNADAKLDITATNKGLLLPRVALTGTANAAPLSAHVAGMTVYNTKDTLDVTKGTYYNNGIKWIKIGDAANAWSLTGNAGTTPGTNYLGTKDSNALVFKTNATNDTSRKMVIMPNGFVGIGARESTSILDITNDNKGMTREDDILINSYGGTTGKMSPGFIGKVARGTYQAPSNLAYGDHLVTFAAEGFVNGGNTGLSNIFSRYKGDGTTNLSNWNFLTSGLRRMIIDEYGRVGIATQNPQARLHIDGAGDNPDTLAPTVAQQANDVVITSSGKIGVGVLSPMGEIEAVSNTFERGIYSTGFYSGYGGVFGVKSARGDVNNLLPTQATNGLGWFSGYGYDGTSFAFSSNGYPTGMLLRASENYTATGIGAQIEFFTTPNGSRAGQQRMLIGQNGNIGINNSNPTEKLEVGGKVKAENLIFTGLPGYATQGDAEADANLPVGSLYKINSTKQVYVK